MSAHLAFLAWREYGEHVVGGNDSDRAIFVAGYEAAAKRYNAALASAYSKGYGADAVIQVARICDEMIDPTGQLLGTIRQLAKESP